MSTTRGLRRLRAISTAMDRHDVTAMRAAFAAFDRAFPGLGKPVPLKPSATARRRKWHRG